jgi:hypothetical protein
LSIIDIPKNSPGFFSISDESTNVFARELISEWRISFKNFTCKHPQTLGTSHLDPTHLTAAVSEVRLYAPADLGTHVD